MKLKQLLCISPLAAAAALCLSGCEVTGAGAYYSSGPAVSSDLVLTYTSGYAGTGYYYGPRGYNYSHRGPGVYYYRTREVVPHTYWSHWHGDSRHYGGPGRWDDRRRDGRYDRDRDHDRHDRNDRDRDGGWRRY
jgi:hypothetical protein